ncbi:hypothetical protein B0H63DRAFT_519893 [Podospora didyma]|uniref:Secreted protein n=1 Tax=Podospora didyma TaxID=330526 RepID=A0AAE0U4I4_9PEZI|nr:hypothetical protein B0H63DRAFT_519893 [Podospora didyma]
MLSSSSGRTTQPRHADSGWWKFASSLFLLTTTLTPLVASLPQGGGGQSPPAPTVQNMTMWGTGCPIGAGGLVQQMRNNTPVFVFSEWGLSLPDPETTSTSVSKFCTEAISLANGPVGMQLRIATVSVSGWAALDQGTKLAFHVETKLGDVLGGSQTAAISAGDLHANGFDVNLQTQPADLWSACVGADGIVPHILIQTTVSLVGTKLADGKLSGGVLGGDKSNLKKALGLHFDPVWRPCA